MRASWRRSSSSKAERSPWRASSTSSTSGSVVEEESIDASAGGRRAGGQGGRSRRGAAKRPMRRGRRVGAARRGDGGPQDRGRAPRRRHHSHQYTSTGVPRRVTPDDQSRSMAALVTRAQPWEAGCGRDRARAVDGDAALEVLGSVQGAERGLAQPVDLPLDLEAPGRAWWPPPCRRAARRRPRRCPWRCSAPTWSARPATTRRIWRARSISMWSPVGSRGRRPAGGGQRGQGGGAGRAVAAQALGLLERHHRLAGELAVATVGRRRASSPARRAAPGGRRPRRPPRRCSSFPSAAGGGGAAVVVVVGCGGGWWSGAVVDVVVLGVVDVDVDVTARGFRASGRHRPAHPQADARGGDRARPARSARHAERGRVQSEPRTFNARRARSVASNPFRLDLGSTGDRSG